MQKIIVKKNHYMPEEDALIIKMYNERKATIEVSEELFNQFKSRRSVNSILYRIQKLRQWAAKEDAAWANRHWLRKLFGISPVGYSAKRRFTVFYC